MIAVLEAPRRPRVSPRPLPLAATLVVALLLGGALAEIGTRFGPLALVALAALLVVAVVSLRSPDRPLMLLAAAVPFGPVSIGPLEVIQAVVLVAVLAVLVPAAARLRIVLPPWQVAVPLAAFVLLAFVSTSVAPIPDVAFRLDIQLVSSVLLVLATVTALTTWQRVQRVTLSLLVAGAVTAAYALVRSGPTETYYAGGVVTGRAQGVFSQPNELGVFATGLFVLAVGTALATRGWPRIISMVSGGLLLGALGVSLSRGAWVGAIVGVAAVAVLSPPSRRPLARGLGVAVAIGLMAALVGVGPFQAIAGRAESLSGAASNPYDQRTQIYAEAVRQIREAPFFGQGPGAFTPEASHTLRVGVLLSIEHAHNLVLNVGVEFGLLGVLALLSLMVGLLTIGRRARRQLVRLGLGREAELPVAYLGGLVAVLTHCMFDYPLRNALSMTTVWFVIALLVAAARVSRTIGATPDVSTERARSAPPPTDRVEETR